MIDWNMDVVSEEEDVDVEIIGYSTGSVPNARIRSMGGSSPLRGAIKMGIVKTPKYTSPSKPNQEFIGREHELDNAIEEAVKHHMSVSEYLNGLITSRRAAKFSK